MKKASEYRYLEAFVFSDGGAGGNQRATLFPNPPSIFQLKINDLTKYKDLQGVHPCSDGTPKWNPECIPLGGSLVGSHLRTTVQFRIFKLVWKSALLRRRNLFTAHLTAPQFEGRVRPRTVLALFKASWAPLRCMASSRVPVSCSRALDNSRRAFWMYSSTWLRYWVVSLFISPKCLTQRRLASGRQPRVCGRRFNSAFPKVAC